MDVNSRFWVKVDKSDGCWMWRAGCISTGYGLFSITKYNRILAHRYSWELVNGPIPDGMVMDHRCHNDTDCPGGKDCPHRKCVNPDHLAPKSNAQNLLASHKHNSKKTHCPRGHEYSPENTRITRRGSRTCRECARIADRKPERNSTLRRRRAKERNQ